MRSAGGSEMQSLVCLDKRGRSDRREECRVSRSKVDSVQLKDGDSVVMIRRRLTLLSTLHARNPSERFWKMTRLLL